MNETLSHGRELKTDTEIRQAMNAKEPILVFQDRMRLRPALPIIGYNDDIVKIADGTTFLRTATSFFTLSEEEKVTYNVSSSK